VKQIVGKTESNQDMRACNQRAIEALHITSKICKVQDFLKPNA